MIFNVVLEPLLYPQAMLKLQEVEAVKFGVLKHLYGLVAIAKPPGYNNQHFNTILM